MENKQEKVMDVFKDDNAKESMKRWLAAIIIVYVLFAGGIEQMFDKPMNMTFISMIFAGALGMILGTLYEKFKK